MALKDKLMTLEDFKAVRDVDVASNSAQFTEIKADLDAQTGIISLIKNYYINTSTTPISLTPSASSAGRMYAVVDCSPGDEFVINAYSDSSVARAWCFIDSANNAISMAEALVDVTDLELTAPSNAAKLIINDMRGGISYKVGNNLMSRVSEIFSNDAKAALLACFRHVAWTDEHGQDYYDALESALYGSEPYWDYEWYATSGVLPEGMTANAYDFSTVPGALHVEKPVMDFDYIGDIRLYVECSLYANNATTGNEQRQSNPQIVIKNKVVSEDQFKGCKVIASPPQTSTFYVGFGVNGTTAIIPEIASRDIHAYDISAINGVYSLTIDGTEISIAQNNNTTSYIDFTGITSANGFPANVTQIMNIKCIKYKKL